MLQAKDLRLQTFHPSLKFLSMQYENKNICKLLHYFLSRNQLFIKFPGRNLGGVLAFLKGFRNDAWMAIVILVLTLPAFLFFFFSLLHFFNVKEPDGWTYGWNLFVFSSALAQQGQEKFPIFVSTRMVYLFMFLCSVVLFESFSASYTSFLSVVTQATPFETLTQLEDTSFVVGAMEGGTIRTLFRVKI